MAEVQSQKRSSGLALHGATVALTPARALTSHVRRRYHTHYRGRYKFAPIVFGFDLLVIGVVMGLLILSVALVFIKPSAQAGLALTFFAPPIRSATPLAFEARVSSKDGRVRDHISLTWDLPPGTEIISAMPPLNEKGEATLEDLKAGETQVARLAVRLFVPPGSVRIGFRIRTLTEQLAGSDIRPVVGSGLRFEPILRPTQAEDVMVPFLLTNDSRAELESITLTTENGSVDGATAMNIDRLHPAEQRLILVRGSVNVPVTVRALARGVLLTSETLTVNAAVQPLTTTVVLTPSTVGSDTVAEVIAATATQLLVFHPQLKQAHQGVRIFDLAPGTQRIILPLDPALPAAAEKWLAIPFQHQNNEIIMGHAAEQFITTPFVLSASARYYALIGGQIGAGPLPPRVGETTRYWIQWKLEPITRDLSNLEARALLPAGVHLTGQKALPQGGELEERDGLIIWRLPFVPATDQPTTAAFEVALTPLASMRNKIVPLINQAEATVIENRSQASLHAQANPVDTTLPEDEKAMGKGRVR